MYGKTLLFSCNFPFFIWFIHLVYIIGIKPASGDHESNFKKLGVIPCGCNTKWTKNKSYSKYLFTCSYPCTPEDVNLEVLKTLKQEFPDISIGYSGNCFHILYNKGGTI